MLRGRRVQRVRLGLQFVPLLRLVRVLFDYVKESNWIHFLFDNSI